MKWVHRVGRAVFALFFIWAGVSKFFGVDAVARQFDRFGLPYWFMVFTGVVEVTAAVLVVAFEGKVRAFGAGLLAATMFCGIILHLAFDSASAAVPALILSVVSVLIAVSAPTLRRDVDG